MKLLCATFDVSRQAVAVARKRKDQPATPRAGHLSGVPASVLLPAIREVISEFPAWGHRKVWATLRRKGFIVSRRHVAEMMKANGEMQEAHAPRPAEKQRGQVVVSEPNRRWATDLTTVWTRRDGVVAVVLTVDCGCRSVLDGAATLSQEATPVLATVAQSLNAEFGTPAAVPDGLDLRSDYGPQYTGAAAAALATHWGFEQTFAPVGRPKGNAVAERTIQTMKLECLWLGDFEDVHAVQRALDAWRRSFNESRPHQSLNWRTPLAVRSAKLGFTDTRRVA